MRSDQFPCRQARKCKEYSLVLLKDVVDLKPTFTKAEASLTNLFLQ